VPNNPSWYDPWQVGFYNETLAPLDLLNALIPFMAPAQQAQAGQYLFGQGATDSSIANWTKNYNVGGAAPSSTADWLKGMGGVSGTALPSYYDTSSPEYNWLTSLTKASQGLGANPNRQQQQQWKSAYDTMMGQAPSDMMKGVGALAFNPTLTRPEFGSVAPLGQYTQRYHQKAGMTSNPWYSG
jgi:hypothetical protein